MRPCGRATWRVFAAASRASLVVLSGVVGTVLHFQGNVEFELEMSPSLAGSELLTRTLTGATPVLSPGTMVILGLIGLSHTYRHPSVALRHEMSSSS